MKPLLVLALAVAATRCGTNSSVTHHAIDSAADVAGGASRAVHRASTSKSEAVIAAADEPGDRMEVRGTVFEPDGVTPAANIVVYVYHTDASGLYQTKAGDPPRLRAWLLTDAQGRYAYRTIRPASYPKSTIPAHVHTQMWGAHFPRQYGTELEFADDPFLEAEHREASRRLGRFGGIVTPARGDDGVWRATHDLRLERKLDEFEESTIHGWRDCPPELRPAALK